MNRDFDCCVVGAGVVGLACAVALARGGNSVVILESAATFGSETSSRNSEVIHAGIYYPEGSLKARLCVEGKAKLYRYCEQRGVPHKRLGKLIFASAEGDLAQLERMAGRAAGAGVDDLRWLSKREAASVEPQLGCAAALLSPSTGIVDSHALMLALLGELEALGGHLVCHTEMVGAERQRSSWTIRVAGEAGPVLAVGAIVNAAGLGAVHVARGIEGLAVEQVPEPAFARGCYFSYSGRVPFRHLIYPVPVPGGLGTHLTLDLAGRARFGPNVEWVDTVDYTVDPRLHGEFLAAARTIWPSIDGAALHPGYAGVRPKVRTADGLYEDFIIAGPQAHGLAGLVNLFGIESPGLTASLAIADEVLSLLRG